MKELQMPKGPINGREPEVSEEDIQRGKRGASLLKAHQRR
jgi:hypothetical protein